MAPTHQPFKRLLALCVGFLALTAVSGQDTDTQAAPSKATIKQTPIAKVATGDQLSANQLFSGSWLVKGDRYTGSIKVKLPGRIYVTHASDLSSDVDVEVKVSGSSEDVVKAVNVTAVYRQMRVKLFASASQALVDQYLLVEVRVREKDSIFRVESEGNGDVVVLEDVLAMTQVTSVPFTLARRLQGPITTNKSGLTPRLLSSAAEIVTGLSVIEDKPAGSATDTLLRSWMLSSGSD